jgi:8-oxo-dGTP pyrophosphatase MutT (NUDIX family)
VAKDGTVQHSAVIARLRRDVVAKEPVDDREVRSLRAFIEAFDQLDEPLSQESNSIHVTGSALVVGPRGVVLLKHKRLGFWLQPGGHVDPGESPWVAALREAREETGLEVRFAGPLDDDGVPELLHVDVHPGGRGHTHLDVRYLFDGGDADPDPPEGESQEIGWYDWDAAVEQADPGLEGILRYLQRELDLQE